jgi:hypothetical protein
MSSTGANKWQKYFSKGDVATAIIKGPAKIYDSTNSIIDTLADGTSITVLKMKTFSSKYAISYTKRSKAVEGFVSDKNVGKPIAKKGATENLGVRAETLTKLGVRKQISFGGKKVECMTFNSHVTLMRSLISGLKTNPKVSESIVEVFEDFAKTNYTTLKWQKQIPDSDINELGKYAGEIIIGLLGLKGNKTPFNTNFYKGKVFSFCIPTDPSFSGVDSFFILGDKTIVPISSKYGVGAKASFFSNLLNKAIDAGVPPRTVIGEVVDSAKRAGVSSSSLTSKQGSKEVLYEYGVRKVLNMSRNAVKDPYAVYTNVKTNGKNTKKLSPEAKLVLDKIKEMADKKIADKLPFSMTSFFSRSMADRLNSDGKSVEAMIEILAGKNFWQANLDIMEWKKGNIKYRMVSSGKASVQIIGSKSAIDDIDAKQGMVNYEVRMP